MIRRHATSASDHKKFSDFILNKNFNIDDGVIGTLSSSSKWNDGVSINNVALSSDFTENLSLFIAGTFLFLFFISQLLNHWSLSPWTLIYSALNDKVVIVS